MPRVRGQHLLQRGNITTTAFNADDEPTLVTDPVGNATLTCYDPQGNKAQTVPPAGVAANDLTPSSCPTNYGAGYNPATSRLAGDATSYAYDSNGNQVDMYTPAQAGETGFETTSYAYDANGNLVKTTAPPSSSPQVPLTRSLQRPTTRMAK